MQLRIIINCVVLMLFCAGMAYGQTDAKNNGKSASKKAADSRAQGKSFQGPGSKGLSKTNGVKGVSFVNAAGDTLMQVRDDGTVVVGAAVANGNALLDIDALNNDKGILIPRLSTAQRNAMFGLGAADEGLAVYDEDSNSFWFWDGTQWQEVGSSSADNLGDHTASQTLDLNGNDISNADSVTANAFIGDGSGLTGIDIVDADADPANELQSLSINGDTLSISDGNSILLPAAMVEVDGDTTNELQSLSLSGDSLSISDGNTVILPPDLVDDADADPANELQSLSINGDTLSISNGNTVILPPSTGADNLGNHTASQTLILNGNYLSGDGDSEGVFVDSDGNVGIGTATPAQQLEITGNMQLPATTDTSGAIYQDGKRLIHSAGSDNFFAGEDAGNLTNTSLGENTAVGAHALEGLTTGSFNTAIGSDALLENSEGSENTAVGVSTLSGNTSGIQNTAVGISAMNNNVSGSGNVALGTAALLQNIAGSDNIAIGKQAGTNTDADNNILIGNPGVSSESNAIYIGNNTHTQTILNGTVSAPAFVGDGSGLTNLPASGWSLTGNSATDPGVNFIGTIDNQPLNFKVRNQLALRLIYAENSSNDTSPNIIGGYHGNQVSSTDPDLIGATISGGGVAESENMVSAAFGTIGGGYDNLTSASGATVSGGLSNTASGIQASVSGGRDNTASGNHAAVGGGRDNSAAGNFSFAAGRRAKIDAAHNGVFLFSDQRNLDFNSAAANEFAARATGGVRFVSAVDGSGNPTAGVKLASGDSVWTTLNGNPIGGGSGWSLTGNAGTDTTVNFIGTTDDMPQDFKVNNQRALRLEASATSINVIGGYNGNAVSVGVEGATIGGGGVSGQVNRVTADFGTVGGGRFNTASGVTTTIAGGSNNTASGLLATIGGGTSNTAGSVAFVGGGQSNTASGNLSTIAGGEGNIASGLNSTVPGGRFNRAEGDFSFAAGINAHISTAHDGAFLWADNTGVNFLSAASNEFAARASGGVRFVTAVSGSTPTAGVKLAAGESTWTDLNGNPLGLDNLGNHIATQVLNLNGNYLSGDGDSEGLFVADNGNVGVGDATPAQALEVAGNAQLSRNDPRLVFHDATGTNGDRQSSIRATLVSQLGNDGPEKQKLGFHVQSGGEVMSLRGNGHVGIGNNAPSTDLEIEATAPEIRLTDERTSSGGTAGLDLGKISWYTRDVSNGSGYEELAAINIVAENSTVAPDGRFEFNNATNGALSTSMVIAASGNVGIGTANPGFRLQVGESGDGSQARANAWTTFSDRRWKRDFQSIDNPLAKLSKINGYYYYWKNNAQDQSRQLGVIAQEVESVLPEIVNSDADGYKSVNYSKLSAFLIEVNQAQQSEIEVQREEIATLQARMVRMEAVLQKLEEMTAAADGNDSRGGE